MNLSDYEYLNQELKNDKFFGNDCCVANLFLLKDKYNIQLKIINNTLFRYFYGENNRTGYAFPLALNNANENYLKQALEFMINDSKAQNTSLKFCLITQEQKNLIDNCLSKYFDNKKIDWKTKREDADYIYLKDNLAQLPGSNYQKKRNHISRFNRIYGTNWEFKSFPQNNIASDIIFVAEKWFDEKGKPEDPVLLLEQQSIRKAVEHSNLFKTAGGVLYIQEKPAAMTLAAPISNSVLDVIYEKSIGEYEKNGAYAVINQQFAKHCGSYLYLNREEDMGIEGLRKAKLSYKPSIILEKFFGELKG